MKILASATIFLVTSVASTAFADNLGMRQDGYGMAGCGLGSMLFASNGKWHQVFAATSNATFGTQTFGISSGTSNCTRAGGVVKLDKEKQVFLAANFETLTEEMAQGSGDTLYAFASLVGCDGATFAKVTQGKFATVYSRTTTAEAFLDAVAADADLAAACKT
jgi:hypothetical protein